MFVARKGVFLFYSADQTLNNCEVPLCDTTTRTVTLLKNRFVTRVCVFDCSVVPLLMLNVGCTVRHGLCLCGREERQGGFQCELCRGAIINVEECSYVVVFESVVCLN